MTIRAALYLRLSLDRSGEQLGVARQREACMRIVEQRGWTLVGEYVDNSISAYDRRKVRPGYNKLTADWEAGAFDAVVCWDLDRFTRQPDQLEHWCRLAEDRGVSLVTVDGELDLGTESGRMFARIKAAVSRQESEHKAKRQRLANAQRRELGKVPAGVRLLGYAKDGTIIEPEAEVVREVFARFTAGESLASIHRDLTARGVTSVKGAPIHRNSLNWMLSNPRYAARMTLGRAETGHRGAWDPIVPDRVFDAAQAILRDPQRIVRREGVERKKLGSGLYLCECGKKVRMTGGRAAEGRYSYECAERHYRRSGHTIDAFVTGVIAAWLETTGAIAPPKEDDDGGAALQRIRERLAQVERDYDDDLIDAQRYAVKRAKILTELREAEEAAARSQAGAAFAALEPGMPRSEAFKIAPLGVRRTIIDTLATVTLLPVRRGVKGFDPDTVRIDPKEAAK